MSLWASIVKPIFLQIHYTFINEQYLYKYLSMQQACWFQNAFFRETSTMQSGMSHINTDALKLTHCWWGAVYQLFRSDFNLLPWRWEKKRWLTKEKFQTAWWRREIESEWSDWKWIELTLVQIQFIVHINVVHFECWSMHKKHLITRFVFLLCWLLEKLARWSLSRFFLCAHCLSALQNLNFTR